MNIRNRELVDRLAAEYVLGTLRGRARRHFERWLVSPQVGSMVKAWEERLAGLEPQLEGITPSPAVWRGIEDRLELHALRRAPAMRWLAIAASVLFFVAIGYITVREPALAPTQLASIQENAGTIYWRVELLGENQELRLQVRARHELAAGKSLELWVLPAPGNHGPPVSLGLLPASGELRRELTAAQRTALIGAKQVAVSLEPAGGSPTGLPTGPVLHVAPLTSV
jgi:anti-sigma-K factor RskA